MNPEGEWCRLDKGYLLPMRVVMAKFRGKLLDGIGKAWAQGELIRPPELAEPRLQNLLNKLGRKKWNVRIQERYAHGKGVLTYLARYVRGGPLANRRLIGYDEAGVTFIYTDHRDGQTKSLSLTPEQFLQRLLWHVPESGMHVIRY